MEKTLRTSLTQIANTQFETLLNGIDTPQVIFLNGYRMNIASWDQVYPDIAKHHGVLLYNRLGIGKSSKASKAQNAEAVVRDMHALFAKLALKPPYILVGHSMGGLFINLYAKTYKDDVAGVVFVDCPHPDEVMEQRSLKLPVLLKAVDYTFKSLDRLFGRFKYSEDESIETSINQIQDAGDFPDIPVAVISGQKRMPFMPQAAYDIHQEYQYKLLKLSPLSKHYKCNNSGHFPQISEPEKVISAILATLNAIK